MCLAKKHDGVLPSLDAIAYGLRSTSAKATTYLNELCMSGLVDERKDGYLEMHNWNGRQFQSDVSTPRVRAFRKRNGNVSETLNETPSETETDTEQRQIQNRAETVSRFDVFWSAYPRKVGKAAALKIWLKLSPDEPLQTRILMKIAEAEKTDQWRKDDGKFIPHPATWLHGARWDDEFSRNGNGNGNGIHRHRREIVEPLAHPEIPDLSNDPELIRLRAWKEGIQ